MTHPDLTQFRVEPAREGLIHLVFDCPERTMNVFSNQAIHELRRFADWLHGADVRGVVIRSGKSTGFCAGADLTELGVAYDMIVAAPPADRFDIAFDHFFPLSHAIRRLETAGKPIAAAIAGVALGGGCELALGAHYRVATRSPRALLGLPECAVGLLPGAGGTQRMPRLVGPALGLEVLLQGRTLQGDEALAAGLVDALVDEGDEIAAAEAWLLSDAAHAVQPWDRPGHAAPDRDALAALISAHRERELARMLGHEPAPLAILDCVDFGFVQPMDGAIRSEMAVFAQLIQRREARNMIRTLFLGKQAYDKAAKGTGLPAEVTAAAAVLGEAVAAGLAQTPRLAEAGFGPGAAGLAPVQSCPAAGTWLEGQPDLLAATRAVGQTAAALLADLDEPMRLQLDHLVVRQGLVPAYLGGVTGLAALAG